MTRFLLNVNRAAHREEAMRAAAPFNDQVAQALLGSLALCPRYEVTPLRSLEAQAAELGIGQLSVKDERQRLGLGSFKALGGAYAVLSLAAEAASAAAGHPVSLADLASGRMAVPAGLTVAAATAGNHGRSVAAGAALIKARCVIFIYDGVPEDQVAAIARHGAEIVHVPGIYDDAVAACRETAAAEGWTVVADTAAGDYRAIPTLVMQGYTAMASELVRQPSTPVTHVFLQAGVGGMAAALAGYRLAAQPDNAPAVIVVEPERAACLLESARLGHAVRIESGARTNMGRLECYEPSSVAWEILSGSAAAFVTISDEDAATAATRLAAAGLATTPSGAAGFAGVLAAAGDAEIRAALGLDDRSHVLVIVTEQASITGQATTAS